MRAVVLISLLCACLQAAGAKDERRAGEELEMMSRFEMTVSVDEGTQGARSFDHKGTKIHVRANPDFTAADVKSASAYQDPGVGWCVLVHLNRGATRRFFELTKKLAGQPTQLVILARGEVLSAPVVRQAIEGGTATISGVFTKEEAGALADAISPR